MARPETVSDEQIAAAIGQSRGHLAAAAKLLNVNVRTVQRRVKANAELQFIVEDERELICDTAELKLFELIQKGNVAAIIFFLKTQCKDRGYVERFTITDDIDELPMDELRKRAAGMMAKIEQREKQEQ